VSDVDLTITRGEAVALVGANGSGKSTLVKALFGLSELQAGSIEVFGTPHQRFKSWRRVGYVPQRGAVGGAIPSTVREVVATGRITSTRPFHRLSNEDRTAIDDAIASVGLTHRAGAPLGTLSGGQQRRALIARALASEPELLVLDEPTAGVDAENQRLLADILGARCAQGSTLLLVTHELGPTRPIITRTVAMRSGSVAYDGPPIGAPDEHDDAWHHHHGDEEHGHSTADPGLDGFGR
jgi:zinc transport system ATP-binding protein